MPRDSNSRLLWFSAALLLLFGAVFLWILNGGGERVEENELGSPGRDEPPPTAPAPETELLPPARIVVSQEALARTTVLWPLRVELDLLQARHLPAEDGVPPIGSGAAARMEGRILGVDDRGARAELRFVEGANRGRVLTTDVAGHFGANDLYPGLSIVEVSGAGLLGSRREVRLRQDQETLLNIPYGRPGSVAGRVQDPSGAGIEGAEVRVDGIRALTGPDGGFAIASVAGGQVLVEVSHPDYASTQELVWLTSGREHSGERVTFTLERGTTLRIAVANNVGGPGPVEVYLFAGQPGQRARPDSIQRNARFPYYHLHPIEVWPGRPETIPGLPMEAVHLYAFRPGAKTLERVVNLRADHELSLALEPSPSITGRVHHGGEPVTGAKVSLEAPNQVRATLDFFRQESFFLETDVLPRLPPAVQVVESDERGRFVLTSFDGLAATRYLEARGPDGKTWGGRFVHAGEENVDLELTGVTLGDSTLSIELPGRWQGLPVEVLVEGAPLDPWILPPDASLEVRELVPGRWRVCVTWHGDPVHEEELVIDGEALLTFPLPPECVDGQEAESWRRAGREYPGTN